MNGILLADKPAGITSAEVVRRVKRRVRVKVGHLGTLDPFATGLLPLCLGEATKIAQFLNTSGKRYEGVIRLGTATDTGDCTGRQIRSAPLPHLAAVDLEALALRFTGQQQQVPPMYSALKREGVPLYRLARRGIDVEREARSVCIDSFTLEAAGPERLRFALACSKGTYVRVLAEDLGAALGSAAHLEVLRRTGFGCFDIAAAVTIDRWERDPSAGLLPIGAALAHMPAVRLDPRAVAAARLGQAWPLRALGADLGEVAVLVDTEGETVAVAVRESAAWRYGRVIGR